MSNAAPHSTVGRYIGQSVKRREDPRLLTGRGRYVDDEQIPGTLHLAFVRSNVARGNITRLDVSAALTAEGVRAVYTGADLNPVPDAPREADAKFTLASATLA